MKYDVTLTETNVGHLCVDAASEAEIEEQTMYGYLRGEVSWESTHLDFAAQKPTGEGHAGE